MKELIHSANKGEILSLLKLEYPDFVQFFVIRMSMNTLGKPLTERELAGYLAYLDEAGYVELKKDKNLYILAAKITKAGMDVVSGWTKDPAIQVR